MNPVLILPLQPSVGNYRFSTTITDVTYIFDVRWNSRDVAWYMDVYEANLTPIIYGIKIVLGVYLGRCSRHRLFRQGVMVAVDTTSQGREATFDDLGTRVEVKYIPAEVLLVSGG